MLPVDQLGHGIRATYLLRDPSESFVSPTKDSRLFGSAELVHADERLRVEVERPAWYPFESRENASVLLCLEGHVYGGQRESFLRRLESLRGDDEVRLASDLLSAALEVDGDFVVLWYDARTNTMALTGDGFGRLPLYYSASDRVVCVARAQRFILSHLQDANVDRGALAQLLLLGNPLERRTIAEGVSRLLPQEVLVVSPRRFRVVSPPRSAFRKPDVGTPASVGALAASLRDAFLAACRDRAIDQYSNVLSLSGGIDSRSTGAGMRAVGVRFSAVTFHAARSSHADERSVASAVARTLGADWRAYEFDHADTKCIDELIRMKVGLNPVEVAFGIDYVRRVQSDFGDAVAFWTGEGADKLLCEHRAIPPRPGPDDLVRFVIAKNAVIDPARVSALTGVRVDDLVGSIRSAVDASSDIERDDAYVHFLLSERVVRYHTEGEDRHRDSVWPITPFFDAEFFALARSIPGEWKRGRRVYRAFLKTLAPDVAALPLAGGHSAPATRRFALEYDMRERLRNYRFTSELHRRVRGLRGSQQATDSPWRESLARLVEAKTIPSAFNTDEVGEIASGHARASTQAMSQLLTAVLAVRSLRGDS